MSVFKIFKIDNNKIININNNNNNNKLYEKSIKLKKHKLFKSQKL